MVFGVDKCNTPSNVQEEENFPKELGTADTIEGKEGLEGEPGQDANVLHTEYEMPKDVCDTVGLPARLERGKVRGYLHMISTVGQRCNDSNQKINTKLLESRKHAKITLIKYLF